MNGQLERAHQIESAPDEQAVLRALGGVQPVQRAMVAALIIVLRRIGAQAGIAKSLPAQGPMNEEPQGGLLGPLSNVQFGSPVSWNPASRASMAGFTATAWWMMGTAPA